MLILLMRGDLCSVFPGYFEERKNVLNAALLFLIHYCYEAKNPSNYLIYLYSVDFFLDYVNRIPKS